MKKSLLTILFAIQLLLVNSQICDITGVSITLDTCDTNDKIGLTLEFDHINTSDSFILSGNGMMANTFAYSELPLALGRFNADCQTDYEIKIVDQLDTTCVEDHTIGLLCCKCRIYDISFDIDDCNRQGFFGITLDFEHEGQGTSFSITGNGNTYGSFQYDSLPIMLFPLLGDCITDYSFEIIDNNDRDCRDSFDIGSVCCTCEINDLTVTPISCDGDSCMQIVVDFEYIGPDSIFNVYDANGSKFGSYLYSNLPLTIDCWPYNGLLSDALTVCDSSISSCCAKTDFETLACDSCVILDLQTEVSGCDSLDQYFLRTGFQYDMRGDSGYCVTINDSTYGPFSYDTTSRVFGPLEGGCNTVDTVIVFDKQYARCQDTTYVENACCDTCRIFDLEAEAIDCNGDSCLIVTINFQHEFTMGSTFDVFGRNGIIGTFGYASLPITVPCFPIVDGDFEYLRVCDKTEPGCCAEIEFEGLDCSPSCEIYDLIAIPTDCDAAGFFFVDLDFMYANTSDSFYVFGNGRAEGPFPYNQLPIRLGPYDGDCRTNYEFIAIDQVDPLCKDDYTVGRICCEECEITNLVVEALECNGDSCIVIDLDFDHDNTGGVGFDVFSRSGFFGFFRYDQLPLRIDCFPISGDSTEYLKVCDNDKTDCCADIEFAALNCDPDTCLIRDLVVEAFDCTDADSFYARVDFIHENECDDNFILVVGNDIFEFNYDSLPVVVGPYKGGCDSNLLFQVFDSICFDCEARFVLDSTCCDTECRLYDLEYEISDCDSNGIFSIDIDFLADNASDSFYLRGNGRDIGPLAYSSLPYTLDSLAGDCTTEYVLALVDSENEDCRIIESIGTVCCNDSCEILDLIVEPVRCDGDSCLVIVVDFDHIGTSGVSFDVFDRIGLIGSYSYDSLPLTIDCFPISGEDFEFIKVCDNDNPDCCAAFEFRAVECDSLCDIYDLIVEETPCDSNDQFSVVITFESENVSDSFIVGGNGRNEGPFAYGDLPVTIGPLNGDCDTEYEFVISDQEDNDCMEEYELGRICCSDTCDIYDLLVETSMCDSNQQFTAVLKFLYTGVSDSFYVEGNARSEGPFSYDELPLSLGPYDADCLTEYVFEVVDAEDDDCDAVIEIGRVCCEDSCQITELKGRAIRCNGDSCIEIILDFEFQGTGSTFDVYDRNGKVGTYGYTMLPFLTIPCYPISGEDFEFVKVCDTDNPSCCASIEFEALDCNPTNVNDLGASGWNVFYNIQKDALSFTSLQSYGSALEFDVLDVNGKVIEHDLLINSQELDVSELKDGLFVVRMKVDHKLHFLKFIKL